MTHLQPLDLVVLAAYLLLVTGIGLYFIRQRDTEDFFVAGRTMHWLPVALSVMATNFSAISFMGMPGFIYKTSLQYTVGLFLAMPIIVIPVIYLFLRFFQGRRLTTVYEYLEERFHVSLRGLGSALFVLLRLCWLATTIYVPAVAISAVTGMSLSTCVLVVGILTTLYTAAGGTRAVIWTDVAQFFVIVVGMAAMGYVLMSSFNWEVAALWQKAAEAGRTRLFDFTFDLKNNMSFWGILVGYVFMMVASYGVDQVIVQRYFATRDFKQGARSVVGQMCVTLPVLAVLSFLGVGMFAFYATHPDLLPKEFSPDMVLPVFVVQQLPVGLSGLMIAAIFAATMSSVSSGINSLTTVCVVDWYERFGSLGTGPAREQRLLKIARVGTVAWGLLATFMALFAKYLGTIVEISVKTNSFFTGVLLGLFLLGVLFKRTNTVGGIIGVIMGMAMVVSLGLYTEVSYWWYSPVGCLATVAFGLTGSMFAPKPAIEKVEGLTL